MAIYVLTYPKIPRRIFKVMATLAASEEGEIEKKDEWQPFYCVPFGRY